MSKRNKHFSTHHLLLHLPLCFSCHSEELISNAKIKHRLYYYQELDNKGRHSQRQEIKCLYNYRRKKHQLKLGSSCDLSSRKSCLLLCKRNTSTLNVDRSIIYTKPLQDVLIKLFHHIITYIAFLLCLSS